MGDRSAAGSRYARTDVSCGPRLRSHIAPSSHTNRRRPVSTTLNPAFSTDATTKAQMKYAPVKICGQFRCQKSARRQQNGNGKTRVRPRTVSNFGTPRCPRQKLVGRLKPKIQVLCALVAFWFSATRSDVSKGEEKYGVSRGRRLHFAFLRFTIHLSAANYELVMCGGSRTSEKPPGFPANFWSRDSAKGSFTASCKLIWNLKELLRYSRHSSCPPPLVAEMAQVVQGGADSGKFRNKQEAFPPWVAYPTPRV